MTRRPAGSITGRLILTLTVGTTLLWLVAAIFSTGILQHELNESFDRALVETARRLLPLAVDSVQDRDEEQGPQEIHQFERDGDHGLVYQLRRPDGRLLLRSEDAPAAPFATEGSAGFADTDDYRVFTLEDPEGRVGIQVAEPLARRRQALAGSTLTLFLPLLLLIPLSAAGIFVAVRRGLRPLGTLQAEIAARDGANLAPLALSGLPRELTPIAQALARLIDRLRAAFEAERQFAANSAHELRTPIAGALAQTQRLIAMTGDDRVRLEARKIEATLRRLAELAEKLMQLARADAGVAVSEVPVEVLPILRLVLADSRMHARRPADIRLAVGPGAEALTARINVDALAIVLRNLIDNALVHSPADTPVEIEVTADGRVAVRNAAPPSPPRRSRACAAASSAAQPPPPAPGSGWRSSRPSSPRWAASCSSIPRCRAAPTASRR